MSITKSMDVYSKIIKGYKLTEYWIEQEFQKLSSVVLFIIKITQLIIEIKNDCWNLKVLSFVTLRNLFKQIKM